MKIIEGHVILVHQVEHEMNPITSECTDVQAILLKKCTLIHE
jgi:hypothetical protein